MHKFNDRIDIGATWVYGTGNAFTAPIGEMLLTDPFSTDYGNIYTKYTNRNAVRYPAYHRMDLGINFRKPTKWGERTWNVSFYNLYNRKNPFFIYINENERTGNREVKQVSLFPIIPSVYYSFKF